MWTPTQFSKRIQHAHVEDFKTGKWHVILYPAGVLVRCPEGKDIAAATANAEEYIAQNHPGYVL